MKWVKNKVIFYFRLYKLKKHVIGFDSTLRGNEPYDVRLQIFRNENKHFPFYPLQTPAKEDSLTVEVYDYNENPDGILVKSYKVDNYYLDDFGKILVNEGITVKNRTLVCTTETYNQIKQ